MDEGYLSAVNNNIENDTYSMDEGYQSGKVVEKESSLQLCCDCLEFCPISGLADIMAVGTYQVIESDLGGKTNRKGRLLLYTVTSEGVATQIQKEETGAILDLKWSSQIKNGSALLGSVTSTGNLDIYKYDANNRKVDILSSISNQKENVLNLSLDWANRIDANAGHNMVVSQSDGFIQNISLMDDLKVINSWHAHGYEAWISAFDYHNTQTVFTGGDDCLFKSWDLRADLLNSTFTSKKHDAGVCTIASHPLNEHIIATGSYDENIRIWDTRSLKNPLSTTNTKGGVWRIKWHHSDPNLLISANMYNNFHIYGSDPAFLTLEQLFIYEEHESIAYGVDWSRNESVHGDMIIGTCSFYDHLLNIWTFNKGITDCGALLCDDPWSAFC